MEAEIIKSFRFEAAHTLAEVPKGHKCSRLHGHSYKVDIHVTGPVNSTGWVMDFAAVKKTVEPLIDSLDHRCLDEIPGLGNSTSELLAKYLWDRLAPALPGLSAVTIWESDTSRCVYRGK